MSKLQEKQFSQTSLLRPETKTHWVDNVYEIEIPLQNNENLCLSIEGGSDNGEFPYFGNPEQDSSNISKHFTKGDIILEIQRQKVAGFTQRDVIAWINNCCKEKKQLHIKAVKAGFLTPDLREFLKSSFKKGSLDHELQNTIRDNLYLRTVPCNHYGTPKPLPGPPPGLHPSSEGKRRRNRSNVEAMTAKSTESDPSRLTPAESHSELGPLPEQPNYPEQQQQPQQESGEQSRSLSELPYGWEQIHDPQYGTYYIDHVNKRTQYENPAFQNSYSQLNGEEVESNPPASTSSQATLPSQAPLSRQTTLQSQTSLDHPPPPSSAPGSSKPPPYQFTDQPEELQGEIITTRLVKSPRGLGFTVVGGDEGAEFLQIKSVVPHGPAWQDNRLQMGDVLVEVNNTKVLGYRHQAMVALFQSLPSGAEVSLTVCRGYPLPFDPEDPHTEILTTVAVSAPDPELISVDIVKGSGGFGFTIADSAYGQKVKKILDASRCQRLQEGDVLVEVNHQQVRATPHSDVVALLKSCPSGQSTNLVVQRGGPLVPVRPPKSKSSGGESGSRPLFRSKTPTADLFSSAVREKETIQRPKTPLVDTRHWSEPNQYSGSSPQFPQPTGQYSGPGTPNTSGHYHPVPPPSTPSSSNPNLMATTPDGGHPFPSQPATPTSSHHQYSGAQHYSTGGPHHYPTTSSHHYSQPSTPGSSQYPHGTPPNTSHHFPGPPTPTSQLHYPPPTHHYPAATYQQYSPHSNHQLVVPNSGSHYGGNSPQPPGGYYHHHHHQQDHYSYQQHSTPTEPGPLADSDQPYYSRKYYSDSRLGEQTPYLNQYFQPFQPINYDNYGPNNRRPYQRFMVTLQRQETGFGFRIVGGTEEGSQVSIGNIVPGGSAELDGRLQTGDELLAVDGQSVVGSSHRHVVQLMAAAAQNGYVNLTLRRPGPYDVAVVRREDEGFGFVIISSVARAGSTIGRIIEGSPADRCGQLHVGDRILAVNGISILHMHHGDIVNLIKDSGYSVILTVGPPNTDDLASSSISQRGERGAPAEQHHAVELLRGARGFGFSIRGGREFGSMPLFVLNIAEGGPAHLNPNIHVGDEILEINGRSTYNMSHQEAIQMIRQSGQTVRLLLRSSQQQQQA